MTKVKSRGQDPGFRFSSLFLSLSQFFLFRLLRSLTLFRFCLLLLALVFSYPVFFFLSFPPLHDFHFVLFYQFHVSLSPFATYISPMPLSLFFKIAVFLAFFFHFQFLFGFFHLGFILILISFYYHAPIVHSVLFLFWLVQLIQHHLYDEFVP